MPQLQQRTALSGAFLAVLGVIPGCVTNGTPPRPGPQPVALPAGSPLAEPDVVLCEMATLVIPRRYEAEFSLTGRGMLPRQAEQGVVRQAARGNARLIWRSGFRIDANDRIEIQLLPGEGVLRLYATGDVTHIRTQKRSVARGMKSLCIEGPEVRYSGEYEEVPVAGVSTNGPP